MDDLAGRNLGRYHVIEALGEGGMASVYKAFDSSLERNVAIKIIRSDKIDGTAQNEFLKRFQREARALAQLDHPYILKVLDYGEQDGIPYLVMPFVQGGTLKQKMGQPMPYREAAGLLAPIAQALEYAHQLKIIHRDVKPANILISQSNTPLLSDFGIAKMIESKESTQLTATGVGIGTPDYMAPEQWMGKADARTDIYSLGVVFFQMITGRLPFRADTPAAVLLKHVQDPLPRPSGFVPSLPEAVEQVIYKALAKEPDQRFQTMGDFERALAKLAQGDLSHVDGEATGEATLLAGATRLAAATPGETVPALAGITPALKNVTGGKTRLLIAGGAGVVVLLALLAGGIWLASSLASKAKANPTLPAAAETIPALSELLSATEIQSGQAETTAPSFVSTGAAFTSIEGFPEDIPILMDNNGDLLTSKNQGMTMYHFTTNLSMEQLDDFYKTGMASNGWEIQNETTQGNTTYWYFTKGDNRLVMIALVQQSGAPVQVNVILQ
jgi:tRNA A-37 threonylcarbamoyl transferase component Bud32